MDVRASFVGANTVRGDVPVEIIKALYRLTSLEKTCSVLDHNILRLSLPMLRILFPKNKCAKIFETHLKTVMLVFIGWLSLSTLS